MTESYISTVDQSRTITLPDSVPVGARVAIVLLPAEAEPAANGARIARFAAVMEAIGAAQTSGFTPPAVSEAEIDARIDRARDTARTTPRSNTQPRTPATA
ncbi:MAG: hypothetical protein M9936_24345 [Caldilinea sp.]|nr:hypothetical protein [Caldilinea sp.]MCO5212843.1 hypothetical protein [Caldilinea sp.]MCW5844151.1 hypothetical protein [Caldilinea sp.]